MRITVRISIDEKKEKEFYFPDATDFCFVDHCQSFRIEKNKKAVYFPIQNVYEVLIDREEDE